MELDQYWHHPDIDPVIWDLPGPLELRWYSLLYVGAFLLGSFLLKKLSSRKRFVFTQEDVEQWTMWGLVGAVIGARIVYCLVYDPWTLMQNPLFLFQVYKGGLSFHGGLLGVITATYLFAKKKNYPFWNLMDAAALATPTGLAMGRLGNFINGELYGRISYVPWAMIFKNAGPYPRHPSQLYELFLEGILLFILLWTLEKKFPKDGQLSLLFLCGYAAARFIAEFFREPDPQLGYLWLGLSMGQILSLLMFVAAALLLFFFRKQNTSWRRG